MGHLCWLVYIILRCVLICFLRGFVYIGLGSREIAELVHINVDVILGIDSYIGTTKGNLDVRPYINGLFPCDVFPFDVVTRLDLDQSIDGGIVVSWCCCEVVRSSSDLVTTHKGTRHKGIVH